MAGDVSITIVGNLTSDPELKYVSNSGAAVVNFTVASTPRSFDRQSGDWKDGETMFLRCSAWRSLAENIASSLNRGMRVVVQGRLKSRSYETQDGQRRTVFELDVEEVGPSLRFATAKVERSSGGSGGGGSWNGGGGNSGGGNSGGGGWSGGGNAGGSDGYAVQSGNAPAPSGGWTTGPSYDEPAPF